MLNTETEKLITFKWSLFYIVIPIVYTVSLSHPRVTVC